MKPLLKVRLPASEVIASFPRELVFGPKHFQGLTFPHLYTLQGLAHIDRLLKFGSSAKHMTGKLMRQSMEILKVEVGIPGPVLSQMYEHFGQNTDLNKLIEKRLENDPLNLAKMLRGFSVAQQDPFWPKIKDLKLPFLYLAGSEDPAYVKLAKNISELNDKIEISVIADAGHNIHFEQPELYIQTIREFLHKHA